MSNHTPSLGTLRLTVRYFASLREQAGRGEERVETRAGTPLELYSELKERHHLNLEAAALRAVVNERYVEMDCRLADGDRVVFIPPVAGG